MNFFQRIVASVKAKLQEFKEEPEQDCVGPCDTLNNNHGIKAVNHAPIDDNFTPDFPVIGQKDHFVWHNSKGVLYHLNIKGVTLRGGKVVQIYYFTADYRKDTATDLPEGFRVHENPRNGFLTICKPGMDNYDTSVDPHAKKDEQDS